MALEMPETPECDRMLKVADEKDTQTVGDFLEWLGHSGYEICRFHEGDEVHYPEYHSPQEWLALRHDIDLDLVEKERQAVLEAIRRQHEVDDLQELAAELAVPHQRA